MVCLWCLVSWYVRLFTDWTCGSDNGSNFKVRVGVEAGWRRTESIRNRGDGNGEMGGGDAGGWYERTTPFTHG